jgi:hypothetical protein
MLLPPNLPNLCSPGASASSLSLQPRRRQSRPASPACGSRPGLLRPQGAEQAEAVPASSTREQHRRATIVLAAGHTESVDERFLAARPTSTRAAAAGDRHRGQRGWREHHRQATGPTPALCAAVSRGRPLHNFGDGRTVLAPHSRHSGTTRHGTTVPPWPSVPCGAVPLSRPRRHDGLLYFRGAKLERVWCADQLGYRHNGVLQVCNCKVMGETKKEIKKKEKTEWHFWGFIFRV